MESHGTHSYFDWQVSTLMLSYDVIDPIARTDDRRQTERQRQVEQEIHDIAQATIPDAYKQNPNLDFPPAVVMLLTRATLKRAFEIVGVSAESVAAH
ncbi:MAG TPA: hypothetical protein VF595_06385 [Tepidisphaeraceae bacterium]|jgi:hypothetical protein